MSSFTGTGDADDQQLFFNGKEVPTEDGEVFNLLASRFKSCCLSDLPLGYKVQLCDRIGGTTDELYARPPHAVFEKVNELEYLAHLESPFLLPSDDFPVDERSRYFADALNSGMAMLKALKDAGRLINVEPKAYEEIAYLSYTVQICDQTFEDAESFVSTLSMHVMEAQTLPKLFLCHATEDKPFVERLALELDRYALHAWYDKREIFVGDSIVDKINAGLEESDYLIAVLSPRSVEKQWVKREMGSSLMRQLDNKGITILPVLMESCKIPPLLADIKYADFSGSFDVGFRELLCAVKGNAGS